MNFERACFYELNDGTGTSVSDTLGNGPAGTVAGTTAGIWANAGGITVNNAAGAAGDNAILLKSDYIDQMMRLDNLAGSVVMMWWFKQPQVPSSGTQCIASYGDINTNTDGGYAVKATDCGLIYSIRGGATWEARGPVLTDILTTAQNDTWFAYGVQIDVFSGKVVSAGYVNGFPQRGARIFNIESAIPRVASSGCGARLLAAANGVNNSGQQLWGQTQVKRFFIGRTSGDQRHNIPKWMQAFYETTSGTPSFMVS